ncbi:hypothetical protein IAU59_002554 [Kwoniella sp. CBS 9459]
MRVYVGALLASFLPPAPATFAYLSLGMFDRRLFLGRPPQLAAAAASTRSGAAIPIKLGDRGRSGKPSPSLALSRKPSIPLRSSAQGRKVVGSIVQQNTASAPSGNDDPGIASTARFNVIGCSTVPDGSSKAVTSSVEASVSTSSSKRSKTAAVARRLLPSRSTLTLTTTRNHKPKADISMATSSVASSSASRLLSTQSSGRLAPTSSSNVLAPRRTVFAQRSTLSLKAGSEDKKGISEGPGAAKTVARQGDGLSRLRPRERSPLALQLRGEKESGLGAVATKANNARLESPALNCAGSMTERRGARLSSMNAQDEASTSSSTQLTTPSKPIRPPVSSSGTPTSRIPTSTFPTPDLPRLVSATWTRPSLDAASPGHGSTPAMKLDDQQQLKDVELSFTADDDIADDRDESGDGLFLDSLDFGFATSRFGPTAPVSSRTLPLPPLDSPLHLQPQTQSSSSGSVGALVGDGDSRGDGDGGLIKPSRSSMGQSRQSWERSLALIKAERDEAIAQVRYLRRDEVKAAWGEVVRAGEGNLEDVRGMLCLLREMREVLELS